MIEFALKFAISRSDMIQQNHSHLYFQLHLSIPYFG